MLGIMLPSDDEDDSEFDDEDFYLELDSDDTFSTPEFGSAAEESDSDAECCGAAKR